MVKKKSGEKHTFGEIQNKILQLMAHSILCKVTKCVHINTHYALMADEVTDSSNRKQFVVCLCWVDKLTFAVNEDLIGLYQVDDITAATHFFPLCKMSYLG